MEHKGARTFSRVLLWVIVGFFGIGFSVFALFPLTAACIAIGIFLHISLGKKENRDKFIKALGFEFRGGVDSAAKVAVEVTKTFTHVVVKTVDAAKKITVNTYVAIGGYEGVEKAIMALEEAAKVGAKIGVRTIAATVAVVRATSDQIKLENAKTPEERKQIEKQIQADDAEYSYVNDGNDDDKQKQKEQTEKLIKQTEELKRQLAKARWAQEKQKKVDDIDKRLEAATQRFKEHMDGINL